MNVSRRPQEPYPSFPRFPEEEYVRSSGTVKKTNELALDYLEHLQQHVEKLKEEIRNKEAEISDLKSEQTAARHIAQIEPLLVLVGGILSAFGVNIVTSSPHLLAGWILSASGIVLQLLAIFISLLLGQRRNKTRRGVR